VSELSWVAVDARTGLIVEDLPGLVVGSVRQTIGRYESATASLPLPTAPGEWLSATRPGAVCMVLLSQAVDGLGNHVGESVPVWGGMVTRRPRTEADTVEMSLSTLEAYFDRRYVGDETFVGVGQNAIVSALVGKYAADGVRPGIPIRVQMSGAGTVRDRTYLDRDDKTLYSVLTELMGVDGGPEWSVGWEWQHNPERLTPVLYVGARIGRAVTAGLAPAATFDIPGPVTTVVVDEDYSAGKGANDVMAVSSATGDVRPQSPRQVTSDTSRPTFELRFTPSTSITQVATLTGHALSALALVADGARTVALSAAEAYAPKLGTDWVIGDDIGFAIGGLSSPEPRRVSSDDLFVDTFTDRFGSSGTVTVAPAPVDLVPAFPGGMSGVARAIGFEMTLGGVAMITPILADVSEGGF